MKTRFKAIGLAALFFAFMLIVWPTSCKKDPQPTPEPTTTDTVPDVPGGDTLVPGPGGDTLVPGPGGDTIVPGPGGDTIVPGPGGDTIVPIPGGGKVVKFYYEGEGIYPSMDTLLRYQNDPDYDTIYLAIRLTCGNSWTPVGYTIMCDSLRRRFSQFSKLHGRLGIRPHEILPNEDSMNMHKMGIAELHRDYLVSKGYYVRPEIGKSNPKNAKPQVHKGTMALPKKNW